MPEQLTRHRLTRLGGAFIGSGIKIVHEGNSLNFQYAANNFSCTVAGEDFDFSQAPASGIILPLDYIIRQPDKVYALVLSQLGMNRRVFARKCVLVKVNKPDAKVFLDKYHLMNSATAAWQKGLSLQNSLMCLASFSKGRRMDRLADDERSFELVRFCSRAGITVTAGLSRLLTDFCRDRNAGDVMTYVDRQVSDGGSFKKAGFKETGITPPNFFLVDRKSFVRIPVKSSNQDFDPRKYYLTRNYGNIKLVYTPPKA
jgi:hypothetical protein